VADCLAETAHRWAPRGDVRFIAHVSVVRSWADAKLAAPGPAALGAGRAPAGGWAGTVAGKNMGREGL